MQPANLRIAVSKIVRHDPDILIYLVQSLDIGGECPRPRLFLLSWRRKSIAGNSNRVMEAALMPRFELTNLYSLA